MPPFEACEPAKAEQEAEIARQRTAGEPMNITPSPMSPSPKAPVSYDGHPIDHAARHSKGRTPPVR